MNLVCLAVFACCLGVPALCQGENLVQLAEKLGAKTLVQFVQDAGLADTLANGAGNFTVFCPTDEAFNRPRIVGILNNNKTFLTDVLNFHVVSGNVYSSQLSNEMVAPSLYQMAKIRINIYNEGKAIAAVTATGSPVVMFDRSATNGVIHVIDRVMFPLPVEPITGLVGKDPMLKTLLTAVKAAGLMATLSGPEPFTVFAPTDAAFQKLPLGTLENLFKNKTALTNVLTYHVLSGTAYSAGLGNGMSVNTVEGKPVSIAINGGEVMVNSATVEMADVSASNGVVHIIDSVLIPPADLPYILP